MIKICKGQEPKEWTEIRLTPGISYDSADKKDLREALLREQGYLCGYCMRRIDSAHSRIEHIKPQSLCTDEEALQYGNMIVCCDGNIEHSSNAYRFHCDRHKGNTEVHFTPFDEDAIRTISYATGDGTMKSVNADIEHDIEYTLNLNLPLLKANRKATLQGVVQQLSQRNNWTRSEIGRLLNYYSTKDHDGKLQEYCGIVVWYLSRKLNR